MTEIDIEQESEGRESGLLRRSFAAELTEGDGRTVDMKIVPYGQRITHNDIGGGRTGRQYREEFVAGAFAHQLNAPNRVLVNVEHEEGIRGVVGHGKALLDREDGLYGSMKIHETADGDKTLMLVREGILNTVSLEFIAKKSVRTAAGVIQRVKANLVNVALTRFGAYPGAEVIGVREQAIIDEDMLPLTYSPELVERCRRAGIRLPEHLEAHPAETGTPAEAGTPEDGTRPAGLETETDFSEV